jgi:hypothetical protein
MSHHEIIAARLDDFIDGLLAAEERRAVERHLDECSRCRAEAEWLTSLRAEVARLPRQIDPPRDLWAGIAARIGAEAAAAPDAIPAPANKVRVLRIDDARRARSVPTPWWTRRGVLAAAAIVLMLASSSVTALLVRGGRGAGVVPVATTTPVGAPDAGRSALVAFEPTEREFAETVEELRFALDTQRERLSPATVAVVEENLRIIDGAIREARAALEADPANRDLTFLLMDVYKKKIDLLQNAVQISQL